MITKIVTARNTAFILRFPKDGAHNSPTIIAIEFSGVNGSNHEEYCVKYSDGTFVAVKDVVESWRNNEVEEL